MLQQFDENGDGMLQASEFYNFTCEVLRTAYDKIIIKDE